MMKKTIFTLAAILAVGLFSCSNDEAVTEATAIDEAENSAEEAEMLRAYRIYDESNSRVVDESVVEKMNGLIRDNEMDNMEAIVALYFPKNEQGGETYNYAITETEIDNENKLVALEVTGIMDDSLDGVKVVFHFTMMDGLHQVTAINEQYRCQPERGSQDWSGEPCI